MSDDELEAVKQDIMQYLLQRPAASDDLEGITRFWITRRRIEVAVRTVERAVAALVEEGLLKREVWESPPGSPFVIRYHLNADGTKNASDQTNEEESDTISAEDK